MYTLYIGNKNYSSWSLRGWLAAKLSGAPFNEVVVQLQGVGPNPTHLAYSPSGYVPALHDGDTVVWDTLAIAEYLAERHPGMWPDDAATRAFATERGIPPDRYEYQMLYGVRRDLQAELKASDYRLRVYVPFGREWFPYFMRRLGERPANVAFVLRGVLGENG